MVRKLRVKKGDINFNLIFSIIAGAVILFLAIYGATKYINTKNYQTSTETATQLNVLFNPLESGLATSTAMTINLKNDARIRVQCSEIEDGSKLGKETISMEIASRLGEQWQGAGAGISAYNKYIFIDKGEGKQLGVFSKSFELPFKIGNLIFVLTEDYCFVSPPAGIETELKELNVSKIKIVKGKSACKKTDKIVCFSSASCDINAYGLCSDYGCESEYDYGYVKKGNDRSYFVDGLMYAAIFASPQLYECNFNRLSYKINLLAKLYSEKASILEKKGCDVGEIQDKLSIFGTLAGKMEDVSFLQTSAEELDEINSNLICRLW